MQANGFQSESVQKHMNFKKKKRSALRNTLLEAQVNRTHREPQQLVPSVLHGVNTATEAACAGTWHKSQAANTRTTLLTWGIATKTKCVQQQSWGPRCMSHLTPYPVGTEEMLRDLRVSQHSKHTHSTQTHSIM